MRKFLFVFVILSYELYIFVTVDGSCEFLNLLKITEEEKSKITEEEKLKHLEFVHVATLHALVCFSNLYAYAKERSGPLKPGVDTMEGTVKSVVGPVYNKFQDVPIELLKYVDRKVNPLLICCFYQFGLFVQFCVEGLAMFCYSTVYWVMYFVHIFLMFRLSNS